MLAARCKQGAADALRTVVGSRTGHIVMGAAVTKHCTRHSQHQPRCVCTCNHMLTNRLTHCASMVRNVQDAGTSLPLYKTVDTVLVTAPVSRTCTRRYTAVQIALQMLTNTTHIHTCTATNVHAPGTNTHVLRSMLDMPAAVALAAAYAATPGLRKALCWSCCRAAA